MENNESLNPENNAPSEEGNDNRLRIILIVLLLVSLIGNFFLMYDNGKMADSYEATVDTLNVEVNDVERLFEHAKNELSQFRNKYVQLDSLLDEKEGELEQKKQAILELMNKNQQTSELNQKLRLELEDLKQEKQAIYDQIIKLLAENKNLRSVNDSLNTELANNEVIMDDQRTKLNTGAKLVVDRMAVNHFRKRLVGGFAPTFDAGKTDKTRVCFDVLNNKLAQNGSRVVSIRLITPDGEVLAGTSQGSFKEARTGKKLLATFNYKLDYQGETEYVCQEWEDDVDLKSGKYKVEVYIDGSKAFSSAYEME